MKALFIGGTGTISSACARACIDRGVELWLLLRGTRDHRVPPGARIIHGDIKTDPGPVIGSLASHHWDCVVDWIAFDEADADRDVKAFAGRTGRFFFISSTSVYQKPLPSPVVTEATPIGNRFWDYADRKARCEIRFLEHHRTSGFPVAIVRPGHTYANFGLPTGIAGLGFGMARRILAGKPVFAHDDGAGTWTLTYNEDFARAFVPLMSATRVEGEAFHIASGEMLPWRRIYELMGEAFDRPVSFHFANSRRINDIDPALGATLLGDKAHSYNFDLSKIRRFVPGSSMRVPFRDGVRRCADWYRTHPDVARPEPEKDAWIDQLIALTPSPDR
jgi:nucleoside-diphosphate-sugar epimerase